MVNVPNILLVDDRRENLLALRALLDGCGASIFTAPSGNDALEQLLEREFALVLLDVQMPGMDGFEVAELMRANAVTRHVPIIFVTAISKEQAHVFRGYASGAVDYLAKPVEPLVLRSKVQVFLDLWRKSDELSRLVAELEGANHTILAQQEELRRLAIHDHLTGLYQRRWFDEVLRKGVAHAVREKAPLSLAMLDVDHFKRVNDTHGHGAGDAVLVGLARVLESSVRASDTVFRYGGEEFVVLFPGTERAAAAGVCERIRQRVEATAFGSGPEPLSVTISAGLAELGELSPPSTEGLASRADERLYRAKKQGRNRVCHDEAVPGGGEPSRRGEPA